VGKKKTRLINNLIYFRVLVEMKGQGFSDKCFLW